MEKQEIIKNWVKYVADNNEIISIVSEVNLWNGSLQDYEFYWMDSLDDIFCGVNPTELLSKLVKGFDITADGYKDTLYGLESCSVCDAVKEIKDNVDEIADAIIKVMGETDLDLPSSLEKWLEGEGE